MDPREQLLIPDEVFALEESGRNPTFTVERFFSRHPDKYRAILELRGMGVSVRRIAGMLSVSVNTVLAVQEREPEIVETAKRKWASLTRAAARMALDEIIERLPSCRDLKALAVTYGILTEKAELLSGNATARVETQDGRTVTHADVLEYLQAVRPPMGLGAERGGQRAAAAVIEVEDVAPAGDQGELAPGAGPAEADQAPAAGEGDDQGPGPIAAPGASCEAGGAADGPEIADRADAPPIHETPANRASNEGVA